MTLINNAMQPNYLQYLQTTPAQNNGNQFAFDPQMSQGVQGGPQGIMQLIQMMIEMMDSLSQQNPQGSQKNQGFNFPQNSNGGSTAAASAAAGSNGSFASAFASALAGGNGSVASASATSGNKGFAVASAAASAGKNGTSASAAASASAGKKGASASAAASASAGKKGASASAAASASSGKKDFKSMSNDELQAYWNKNKDSASGAEIHKREKSSDNKTSEGKKLHDPLEVDINGEKYVFVKDQNKNGKVDGPQEFLGYNDSKENLFKGMKELDKNGDGQVSKSEMDAQGVKLQKVDKATGKLTDQTADVANVNLNSFKANQNFNGQGNAGNFQVELGNGQTVQGKEVFENMQKLMSYFN